MNPSNPNAGEPVNPNRAISPEPVGSSVNPLSNLESVVAAAQQAVAAESDLAAAQTTPKAQFENQFGSESTATPPVAEAPADASVASLDPSINTVDDLLAKGPQVVESPVPVEKTPADKLRQKISDDIDAFLEEVAKERAAA